MRNRGYLELFIYSFTIYLLFGTLNELFTTDLDMHYPFDLWTIAHFFMGIWLYALLRYLGFDRNLSFGIAVILGVSFEALEYVFQTIFMEFDYLFYECVANRMTDIFVDVLSVIVMRIIDGKKQSELVGVDF